MKKADIWLIGILLSIGIIACIVLFLFPKKGNKVAVYVDGELIQEFSLETDTEYDIVTKYGNNHLIIQNHKAYISEADCKDELCVHQKAIDKNQQTIVCLPHKVVVQIENGEEQDIDAIVK